MQSWPEPGSVLNGGKVAIALPRLRNTHSKRIPPKI